MQCSIKGWQDNRNKEKSETEGHQERSHRFVCLHYKGNMELGFRDRAKRGKSNQIMGRAAGAGPVM